MCLGRRHQTVKLLDAFGTHHIRDVASAFIGYLNLPITIIQMLESGADAKWENGGVTHQWKFQSNIEECRRISGWRNVCEH